MKRSSKRRAFHVFAPLFCLSVSTTSLAWENTVIAVADCDPHLLTYGGITQPLYQHSTCDAGYVRSTVTTTPASSKLFLTTSNAPKGLYHADSGISDTARVIPQDPALLGTNGTLSFSARLSGSLQSNGLGNMSITFHGWDYIPDPPPSRGSTVQPVYGYVYGQKSELPKQIDEVISWQLPIIYGVDKPYLITTGLTFSGEGDSLADFSHTMQLLGVKALDASGKEIVASITSGSGIDLAYPLPVPEPETYALMLAGLGLVGFAARRRGSA